MFWGRKMGALVIKVLLVFGCIGRKRWAIGRDECSHIVCPRFLLQRIVGL